MAWGVRVGVSRLSRAVPTSLQRSYLPEMVSSSFTNDILAPGLLSGGCSTVTVCFSLPLSQNSELPSAQEVKDFLKQKTLVVFPKLHPLKLKHLLQSPGWMLLPLEGQIFSLPTAAYCGARAALPETNPTQDSPQLFPGHLFPRGLVKSADVLCDVLLVGQFCFLLLGLISNPCRSHIWICLSDCFAGGPQLLSAVSTAPAQCQAQLHAVLLSAAPSRRSLLGTWFWSARGQMKLRDLN